MNLRTLAFFGVVATALASQPAFGATAFDFEGVPGGTYSGGLTVVDGPVTLTITPENAPQGSIYVASFSVPLVMRGVIGNAGSSIQFQNFAPLRFSFSSALDSITFNFGDAGGDSDSPVSISAYSAGGSLLGTSNALYGAGNGAGGSLTLNFAGASYYIASSGSDRNNEHSLFYDISGYSLANSGAVPEPAIWMSLILGFAVAGAAMRRPKFHRSSQILA